VKRRFGDRIARRIRLTISDELVFLQHSLMISTGRRAGLAPAKSLTGQAINASKQFACGIPGCLLWSVTEVSFDIPRLVGLLNGVWLSAVGGSDSPIVPMFDYRSLAERRLGLGFTMRLGRSYAWKNLHPIDPVVADDAAEGPGAADSDEAVTDSVPLQHEGAPGMGQRALSQLESEFRLAIADRPPHQEAAVEPQKPGFARLPWADRDAGVEQRPGRKKSGISACPVCGRRRSRIRFSSVGGRLMSRCLRCDLLSIVNPLEEQDPVAHAEHLRYSMKTFWFHLRGQLKELGRRGPVGYSGPEEYSDPIAQAARDLAFIVPLEDLERYTDPGKCPAILLFHTLECVPDPESLLAKCYRMLAVDGRLFVAA
jgi:hypothetical protein